MSTIPFAAPFYPPLVKPSPRPLRFPFNLIKLLGNNLEIIPEQAYREPIVLSPGPPRMAFFTGAEVVKNLLLTRHAEFPKGGLQVEILAPMFGNAMISSEGREWKWQRGAAAPLFRHDELLDYGPIMTAAAESVVAGWRAADPGGIQPIHHDMMRAAFRVISSTMLAGGATDMIRTIEQGHAAYYRGINWWVMYTPAQPAALDAASGRQGRPGARDPAAAGRQRAGAEAPGQRRRGRRSPRAPEPLRRRRDRCADVRRAPRRQHPRRSSSPASTPRRSP